MRSQLELIDIDGVEYWHSPGLEPAAPAVRALPGFDEYVLGYQDRSAQLAAEFAATIVPGGNGMFLSTVVVNGEIIGTWRRTSTTKQVSVELVPFVDLSARARAGTVKELERYARYLNRPVLLV